MTPEEYQALYAAKDAEEAARAEKMKKEVFDPEDRDRRLAEGLRVWIPLRTCGRFMEAGYVFAGLNAYWYKKERCHLIRSKDDLPVIRERLAAKGFDLIEAPNGGWTSKKRKS